MIKPGFIKGVILIALIFAIYYFQFIQDIAHYFRTDQIRSCLVDAGGFAPLLYMVIMAAAVVVSPIPSLPLDIAAGAYFGPFFGTVYSVIGALTGAVISFMIARVLGRQIIERFLGGHINFCESCSDKILTKIVFLSRLLPVVSFDVISYGAGLTKMTLKKFSVATFLGMIPLTFMYNYFGSVLVFGGTLTFILGFVIVILFFMVPFWLEGKDVMRRMKHD